MNYPSDWPKTGRLNDAMLTLPDDLAEIPSYLWPAIVIDVPGIGLVRPLQDSSDWTDAGIEEASRPLEDPMPDSTLELSVTPYQRLPLYEGSTWDAKAADLRVRAFLSDDGSGDQDKINFPKYRRCFVFYNGDKPEVMSEYKGQILDVQDVGNGPELVVAKKAVQTLGAIMQGSRGGINVSDADREKGKAILSKYYQMWDDVAPWDRGTPEETPEPAMPEGAMPMEEPMSYRLKQLMEGGFKERLEMAGKMLRDQYGYSASIEDMDESKIDFEISPTEGDERYFQAPYTMTDGALKIGVPVEMVKVYKPKSEVEASASLQERAQTAHTRLLEATGHTSTSEAMAKLERLLEDAKAKPALEARVLELEEVHYQTERRVMLEEAQRSGRWTKALEEAGDRMADMARRLGEDRVKALSSHWSSSPVVFAPGGATPPAMPVRHVSGDLKESASWAAEMFGMSATDLEKALAEKLNK